MARYQRWNALLDLLPGDGELTVAEAARALGVSVAPPLVLVTSCCLAS